MDRIPTEVLNMVIGLIDEPDPHASQAIFRSLRSVNKHLSALVTPKVFHIVPLWISATSLGKLNSISENLQLSKFVHTIEFSPLQIKAMSSTSASDEMIKDGLDDHLYTLTASELGVVQYEGARARYGAEQDMLCAKDLGVKALARTFKRLSNLACFKVILRSRSIGSKELNKAFIQISAGDIDKGCKKALSVAMQALVKGQPRITSFQLTAPPFLDSLEELRRDPQNMNLPTWDIHYSASSTAGVFYREDFLFRPLQAFWSLLELSIALPELGAGNDFTLFYAAIVGCLNQTSTLADLKIINNSDFACVDTLPRALKGDILPNLRNLELKYFYLRDARALSALFEPHHTKLEYINLWRVGVEIDATTHGDWPDILEDMKEWEWSALKTFMITECYDDEIEVEVAQFLTGRTDENPLVDY